MNATEIPEEALRKYGSSDPDDITIARDGTGLVSSGWSNVRRDENGRWTSGAGGGIGPVHRGFTDEYAMDSVNSVTTKMEEDARIAREFPMQSHGAVASYVAGQDRGWPVREKDVHAHLGDRSQMSPAEKAAATRRLNAKAEYVREDAELRHGPPASEEFTAKIETAVALEAENPAMVTVVGNYGEIPVAAVENNEAGGKYLGTGIMISESAFQFDALQNDLQTSDYGVDMSLTGTLRHEYGHHVSARSRMNPAHDASRASFYSAYSSWQTRQGGGFSTGGYAPGRTGSGLSVYGQTNQEEGFAETFSMITHPSFDRSLVTDPDVQVMVDTVSTIAGL